MSNFLRAAISIVALLICTGAEADTFPSRPLRVVVGFPPGGGVDMLARTLAPKMAEGLGQPIVVDNRVGAGSTLAATLVAKAAPDGYTLLLVSASHAVTASIYKNLPYDATRDFRPITLVASSPNVLLSNLEFGARSVGDLVRLARASPGAINYASGGAGTTGHLSGELLNLQAGVQLTHIPYKGNPLALADLVAGRVQLMMTTVPTAIPYVKAGRIRALAVTSAKRFSLLPDVPTVAESGVPGYESNNWFGMLGPRAMPAAVSDRLRAEIVKSAQDSRIAELVRRQGAEPVTSTSEEFGAYLQAETAKWRRIVQTSGIQADP